MLIFARQSFAAFAISAAMAFVASVAHAATANVDRGTLVDQEMARWKKGLDAIDACDALVGRSPGAFPDQARWAESAESCLSEGEPTLYTVRARAAIAAAIRNTAETTLPRRSAAYWLEAGKARAELAIFERALAEEIRRFGAWLEAGTGSATPAFYSEEIPPEEMEPSGKYWPAVWALYSTHLRDAALDACALRDLLHDHDLDDVLPAIPTGPSRVGDHWILACMQRHRLEIQTDFFYTFFDQPAENFMFARPAK